MLKLQFNRSPIYCVNIKYIQMKKFLSQAIVVSILILLPLLNVTAQEVGIGEWRDHLPYRQVISIARAGEKIYAATPYSLFYYDQADNSINRLNKINGLSDVGINQIAYLDELKTLVIAYSNANIDLIKDGEIINLSDIKRKPILGNKSINHIGFIGKRAYLSCGFGIVVLDIEKEEFPEPIYYIGEEGSAINVNATTYNSEDSLIYAATDVGIYHASFYSPNLANYAEWTRESGLLLPVGPFNHIASLNNRIYINKKGPGYSTDAMFVKVNNQWELFEKDNTANRFSVKVFKNELVVCHNLAVDFFDVVGVRQRTLYSYNPGNINPKDALIDEKNDVWIGDGLEGLTKIPSSGETVKFLPNGPDFPDVNALSSGGKDVWVVPGGRNSDYGGLYRQARFAGFVDGQWKTIDKEQDPFLKDYRDVLSVSVDPANNKRVYLGTWEYGLLEYVNGEFSKHYTPENSSLQGAIFDSKWVGIGGIAFDSKNDMWVTNSSAPSVLSVKRTDGTWQAFDLGSVATGTYMTKIIVDKSNQKWMIPRDHALIVFNDNNTKDISDDQVRRLTSAAGNGNLPGSFIQCLAADREGLVWIGTNEGVGVIYSPANVFSGQNFDAQRVLIDQDGQGQYLLITESVTAIAVDGSNRKWFGTDRAGVFLMSQDGTREILHFTAENSPLLSNSITDIAINNDGEVFFGTSNGVISYRGESITPNTNLDNVVVFPNPVREGYNGSIAIKGLVDGSSVKITDISGSLVYSTLAEGGQALWNGRNFDSKRVKTGVYLVYITNADGSQTKVTKIMFIN